MATLEFDPDKDAANLAKHGVSLSRAAELEVDVTVSDPRFGEPRFKAYGRLDGLIWCLAFTYRSGRIRAISLRRVHGKEYRRYVS